jgi:hypothetical protein
MKNSHFYIVWTPEGNNPIVRHATKEMAIAEAKRLAGLPFEGRCTSKEFFVLEAQYSVKAVLKIEETTLLNRTQ